MSVLIRPEQPSDVAAIRAVHVAAFPTSAEADLVDLCRMRGRNQVSLVAVDGDNVVGHILFTPVTVGGELTRGTGLAPVAVLPSHQKRGVGKLLCRRGLEACRAAGLQFAVVLGSTKYYGQFGFRRASDFGLGNEYGEDDAFMAMELRPDGLPGSSGLVQYCTEFKETGV
ncbi:MAG: N-acetyltransferase [Planctomycetes bacterium]|nr:N-acetyltransferase [Planctomycetota bacterium]